MAPGLVLMAWVISVGYLLIRDWRRNCPSENGLWLPLVWLSIIGSRAVSAWLSFGPRVESSGDVLEGSPLDRNIYLSLIILGICVLWLRKVQWAEVAWRNRAILQFVAYCGLSVLWSDFTFVALKRYVKEIGTLIMAVVAVTGRDSRESIEALIRRTCYLLIPLSVVLIKYFPEVGRAYSRWTGQAFDTGVTEEKNSLGVLCLIFGLYLVWRLSDRTRAGSGSDGRRGSWIFVFMLGMVAWLLARANSATSFACLAAGGGLIVAARRRWVVIDPARIGGQVLTAVSVVMAASLLLDVKGVALSLLGRGESLTGRTTIWSLAIKNVRSPLLGAGYDSFWLGVRDLEWFGSFSFNVLQAHNGYIETYLNLGVVGVISLLAMLGGVYRRVKLRLIDDYEFGILCVTVFAVVLVHNVTEASFKGMSVLWMLLLLVGMEPPHRPGGGEMDREGVSIRDQGGT